MSEYIHTADETNEHIETYDTNEERMREIQRRADAAGLVLRYRDECEVGEGFAWRYRLIPKPLVKRYEAHEEVETLDVVSLKSPAAVFVMYATDSRPTLHVEDIDARTRTEKLRDAANLILQQLGDKAKLKDLYALSAVRWMMLAVQSLFDTGWAPKHPRYVRDRMLVEGTLLGLHVSFKRAKSGEGSMGTYTLRSRETLPQGCPPLTVQLTYGKGRRFHLSRPLGADESKRLPWYERTSSTRSDIDKLRHDLQMWNTALMSSVGWSLERSESSRFFAPSGGLSALRDGLKVITMCSYSDAWLAHTTEVVNLMPKSERYVDGYKQTHVALHVLGSRGLQNMLYTSLRELSLPLLASTLQEATTMAKLPVRVVLDMGEVNPCDCAVWLEYSRDGSPLVGRDPAARIVWRQSQDPLDTTPALWMRAERSAAALDSTHQVSSLSPQDEKKVLRALEECETVRALLLALPYMLEVLESYDPKNVRTLGEMLRATVQRTAVEVRALN